MPARLAWSQKCLKEPASDGGPYWEAKYEFVTPEGKVYLGHSGSTGKEMPEKGDSIEIIYDKQTPDSNLPRDLFLFYTFTGYS